MYPIYEQFVRQRDQERQSAAARRCMVDRTLTARRWQRAAAWTAHRAAMAERASREIRPVPSWTL